jgi:hypothetical protein
MCLYVAKAKLSHTLFPMCRSEPRSCTSLVRHFQSLSSQLSRGIVLKCLTTRTTVCPCRRYHRWLEAEEQVVSITAGRRQLPCMDPSIAAPLTVLWHDTCRYWPESHGAILRQLLEMVWEDFLADGRSFLRLYTTCMHLTPPMLR